MDYTPAGIPNPEETTAPRSALTRGRKLALVALVVLLAFGYFGYTAFQSATAFYMTVDELVAQGPDAAQSVQVKGTLVPDTFARADATSTLASFLLTENGAQVEASYDGVLPDLFFNPHSEIVLGGVYTDGGVFHADRVYVKCPSKYQALQVENPSVVPPAI